MILGEHPVASLDAATGPLKYHRQQTAKTRPADEGLVLRAQRFALRQLMRQSGASQHSVERFLRSERVQPVTRAKLAQAAEKLERRGQIIVKERPASEGRSWMEN